MKLGFQLFKNTSSGKLRKERKKFGFQGVPIKTFEAGVKKNVI